MWNSATRQRAAMSKTASPAQEPPEAGKGCEHPAPAGSAAPIPAKRRVRTDRWRSRWPSRGQPGCLAESRVWGSGTASGRLRRTADPAEAARMRRQENVCERGRRPGVLKVGRDVSCQLPPSLCVAVLAALVTFTVNCPAWRCLQLNPRVILGVCPLPPPWCQGPRPPTAEPQTASRRETLRRRSSSASSAAPP